MIQQETMLKSLEELRDSLESSQPGTSDFLNKNKENYQLFGHLIDCQNNYEKGVQVLLKDFLDTLISKDGKLESFGEWHEENNDKA